MTEISIQCELDGAAIPGFPWLDAKHYKHFLTRQIRVTNTTDFANAIPSLDTGVSYRVGFFFIMADQTISVEIAGAEGRNLAAGAPFIVGNANAAHSNAAPFVRMKPSATANILVVVGIL